MGDNSSWFAKYYQSWWCTRDYTFIGLHSPDSMSTLTLQNPEGV